MKKILTMLLACVLCFPAGAFAGSKTKAQWLFGLPVDNKLYLNSTHYIYYNTSTSSIDMSTDFVVSGNDIIFGNAETISNATNGLIKFTDGTNTLLNISDDGTTGSIYFGSASRKISDSGSAIGISTDVAVTGEIDVSGIIEAGSGNHELTNAAGLIDGEKIQDDTIDDDSLDFADITGADLTLTDCGAVTATGNFKFNAGLKQSYIALSDSGTLTASYASIVNCTKNGLQEVILPTAVGNAGLTFTIKKTGTAGVVTITTDGTETIDGSDDYTAVDAQYDFITIVSDGANWIITSRYIQ